MRILIAGDFCPQYGVAELFNRGDFKTVLGELCDTISSADYSIVNFECPITYGEEIPIEKCGPNLHCSEHGISALKWVGFDCVTLANNHFLDYGKEGVDNTIKVCEKHDMDYVGGGRNLQIASQILYKQIGKEIIAIINCCEHEFSIATENTAGSNPLNPIQQYYSIKEARKKANYVILIVHGGHEHYQLPSPRMKETYRFFVESGADAVINHHQHCFSGFEIYKEKPIFYGIGNFCFCDNSSINSIWNEGYLVGLNFQKDKSISWNIIPYVQCNGNNSVLLMNEEKKLSFNKTLNYLNDIILDDKLLREEHNKMKEHYAQGYRCLFQPYETRLFKGLYNHGLLPSLVSKRKKNSIMNYLMCESHLERLIYAVKNL